MLTDRYIYKQKVKGCNNDDDDDNDDGDDDDNSSSTVYFRVLSEQQPGISHVIKRSQDARNQLLSGNSSTKHCRAQLQEWPGH